MDRPTRPEYKDRKTIIIEENLKGGRGLRGLSSIGYCKWKDSTIYIMY